MKLYCTRDKNFSTIEIWNKEPYWEAGIFGEKDDSECLAYELYDTYAFQILLGPIIEENEMVILEKTEVGDKITVKVLETWEFYDGCEKCGHPIPDSEL